MPADFLLKSLRIAGLGLLVASCAGAYGMTANDTGGMIPWSPASELAALDIAEAHCAHYGRYAIITSIHPWPGDYIGFVCRIPDRWGPILR